MGSGRTSRRGVVPNEHKWPRHHLRRSQHGRGRHRSAGRGAGRGNCGCGRRRQRCSAVVCGSHSWGGNSGDGSYGLRCSAVGCGSWGGNSGDGSYGLRCSAVGCGSWGGNSGDGSYGLRCSAVGCGSWGGNGGDGSCGCGGQHLGRSGSNELARIRDHHQGRSRGRRRTTSVCNPLRCRYDLNAALSGGRPGANLLHLARGRDRCQ